MENWGGVFWEVLLVNGLKKMVRKNNNFLASLATLLHCWTGAKNLDCNCCQVQCLCVPDVMEAVGFCYPSLKCIISTQPISTETVLLRLVNSSSGCSRIVYSEISIAWTCNFVLVPSLVYCRCYVPRKHSNLRQC